MSLINDALQKAESGVRSSAPLPRKPSPWKFRALLGAFTLLTLSGLVLLAQNRPPAANAPGSAVAANTASVSAIRVPFLADRQLALNGIIREEGGKSLALIGDRTVAEGEMVAGAKLIRIGADEIELEKEGKATTLKLRN